MLARIDREASKDTNKEDEEEEDNRKTHAILLIKKEDVRRPGIYLHYKVKMTDEVWMPRSGKWYFPILKPVDLLKSRMPSQVPRIPDYKSIGEIVAKKAKSMQRVRSQNLVHKKNFVNPVTHWKWLLENWKIRSSKVHTTLIQNDCYTK